MRRASPGEAPVKPPRRSSHCADPSTSGDALRIAVVSDGSGYRPRSRGAQPFDAVLDEDAALVAELGQVRTTPLAVEVGSGAELAARVQQLPDDVAAAFLTRVDPETARAAQLELELAGGRQALTDEDTAAIALVASSLAYLRRIDRNPATARVLVAGAVGMPVLTPLLMACGIFEVSLWNESDEQWFPRRRAARDADVVIDLLHGTTLAALGPDRPDGSVIPHLGLNGRTAAAPGILRALTCYPPGLVELDILLFRDCALAIAAADSGRMPWPTLLRDPRLISAVETAVHRSVRGHLPG
jgi:hypothetical protein